MHCMPLRNRVEEEKPHLAQPLIFTSMVTASHAFWPVYLAAFCSYSLNTIHCPQHPGQQCGRSEQLTEREPHGAGSVPARSGAEHHVLPAPALAGLQTGNLFMLQTASVCWERERKGVDIPGENSAFSLRGSDGPGPSVWGQQQQQRADKRTGLRHRGFISFTSNSSTEFSPRSSPVVSGVISAPVPRAAVCSGRFSFSAHQNPSVMPPARR